jgi:hypothetical protein
MIETGFESGNVSVVLELKVPDGATVVAEHRSCRGA